MKKFVASLLVLLLFACSAVPVFADTWRLVPYRVTSHSTNYLNIYGNLGSNMNGRKLSLYNTTNPGIDSTFTMVYETYENSRNMYLYVWQGETRYAINRSLTVKTYTRPGLASVSGNEAIMWRLVRETGVGYIDSAFKPYASDPSQVVNLQFHSQGLQYQGDYNGAMCYFRAGVGEWDHA